MRQHPAVPAPPTRNKEVADFLAKCHGRPVSHVEPLSGGFWSSAFGYRLDERELVVRFGEIREGFEMDRAAVVFARPGLPVPDVLEIGDAFDRAYAISVRHRGRFLEDVRPDECAAVGPLSSARSPLSALCRAQPTRHPPGTRGTGRPRAPRGDAV